MCTAIVDALESLFFPTKATVTPHGDCPLAPIFSLQTVLTDSQADDAMKGWHNKEVAKKS